MLYYDLDKEKFVTQAGYDSDNTGFSRKMGSGGDLVIEFSRGGVTEDLPETAQVRFGLKNAGEYEGDLVALAETDDFIKVPVTTGRYSAPLDLNTAAIKALLLVDGDESNDLEKVVIMGQMDFRNDPADPWSKSPTLSVTVHNSVLQDTDGMEHDPVPPYPLAAEVIAMQVDLDSLMAAKDLEAMDTGRSYDIGEAFYWIDGKNYRVAAAAAAGETPATDPAKFQRLGLQTDEEILTAVESESGRSVSIDGAKLDTLAKVNSIANKEAAYALTGVAAGTVYKTEDTGQVLEKVDHVPAIQQSFIIGTDGDPKTYASASLAGLWAWDGSNNKFAHEDDDVSDGMTHNGSYWTITYTSFGQFDSAPCDASVHPADATPWVISADPIAQGTGSLNEIDIYEPRNWKHDGTILVRDNDDKILLTNLPDGQQVEIVGEGGRIEQLPASPLPDIKRGFIVSSEGNPRSSIFDGGNSVSGAFFWHEADSQFVRDDDGTFYAAYVTHDGSRWQIGYQMNYFFQSAPCASTVHPADATGWTTYDAGGGGGIGQGTIADDGLVKTRACEVYNSPQYNTSGSTPWRTIKNTVYLTVIDYAISGGFDFNGVTIANGGSEGVGWVPVGEAIPTDAPNTLVLSSVNGSNRDQSEKVIQDADNAILADKYPSGALVAITTPA